MRKPSPRGANQRAEEGDVIRTRLPGDEQMFASPRSFLALAAAAMVWLDATQASAQSLPSGFVQNEIAGTWDEVGGLAFSQDGTRLFVVERGGKVWIVENGVRLASPFLDLSAEVGSWRDFGLLGFALHPAFDSNGYVYALYVVDRYHLFNSGTPGYDPDLLESQRFEATIGRISRFTADPASGRRRVLPGSQLVLIGATPDDGIPILHQSHGTGQLAFGQDGTLLATNGDGASYDSIDAGSAGETNWSQALDDGIIEPWENVGAWRSQLLDSLSGKVLRFDPLTGDGIPSNPWYDPARPGSALSRTFALGLRNPYRFSLRPGTGSHDPADADPGRFYIGDVGWNRAEDLHVLRQPAEDFGWPAFEGLEVQSDYWDDGRAHPLLKNPLFGQGGCTEYLLRFRSLIDEASQNPSDPPSWPNPCDPSVPIPDQWLDPSDGTLYVYPKHVHARPPIAWRGNAQIATWDASGNATDVTLGSEQSPVAGTNFSGNASTGGVWYTGTDFPSEWRNTYFHADYGAGWIKSFAFDAADELIDVVDFVTAGEPVTFVATNPRTGGIYYVKWADRVREVRWAGMGNTAPTALAVPSESWITEPQLTLQFSGSGSSDPDPGTVLSYFWDFDDGATSTLQNPSHGFTALGGTPRTFRVRLTVSDEEGNVDDAEARVSLNNSPPAVAITSPLDGALYGMSGPTTVSLTSSISDAQHSPGQLGCSLLSELVHNNHAHREPVIPACSASVQISPVGCDGNVYLWRFTLTVTDPEGLSTSDVVELYPDCLEGACGPDGAPCSDGNACTGPDRCAAGGCAGQPLPDSDSDGYCDASDNCVNTPNDQADPGGIGAGSAPDGIGDACQCGDLDLDGRVLLSDPLAWRSALAADLPLTGPAADLCNVFGSSSCGLADLVVLRRALHPLGPGISPICAASRL